MTIENLEHSRKKATFDITAEEFSAALDKAFEICNQKVTIKDSAKEKPQDMSMKKTTGWNRYTMKRSMKS